MTYELIYSHGGHGGPYNSMRDALDGANRYAIGLPYSNSVEIHRRTDKLFGKETVLARVSVSRTKNELSVDFWRGIYFEEMDRRELDLPREDGYNQESVELFTDEEIALFTGETM